jgi:hypothetical protein
MGDSKYHRFDSLVGDKTSRRELFNDPKVANEFEIINVGNAELTLNESYAFTSVSPTVISNDGVVTVSFTSADPKYGDWIGAYTRTHSNVTSFAPVKWGWCDDHPSYLTSGSGSLDFQLTNLRDEIVFTYFTGSLHHPVAVAQASTTVNFENVNQPLRPRMVATGDPDVFNLVWSSANSKMPTLKWGTSSGNYSQVVTAMTDHINHTEYCGYPATTFGYHDLGQIHSANVTGMRALSAQQIYYKFGDDDTADFSEEFVFLVPPRAGMQPPNRPTTVILFDDFGRGSTDDTFTWNEYGRPALNTTLSVAELVSRGEVDAIYHGGDISYATGYLAVWDFWLNMITPMASGTLYLSTVGNHESDWPNHTFYPVYDSGGECGVATTRLMPQPAPATTDKPWWSYDVGLIHFVGMSSEHNFTTGSEQWLWLKNDLESVDRAVTPWVLYGSHRPMYINSNFGGTMTSDIDVMDSLIEHVEPLLYENRVDIGFYGHNHVVQRHSAVYQKSVVQAAEAVEDANGNTWHVHTNPQATIHYVIGTGGAAFTQNAVEPKPEWNEEFFYKWGYAKVQAVNASYLTWEWIDSGNEEVLDRMAVWQGNHSATWSVVDSPSTGGRGTPVAGITIAAIAGVVAVGVAIALLIRRYKPVTWWNSFTSSSGDMHNPLCTSTHSNAPLNNEEQRRDLELIDIDAQKGVALKTVASSMSAPPASASAALHTMKSVNPEGQV